MDEWECGGVIGRRGKGTGRDPGRTRLTPADLKTELGVSLGQTRPDLVVCVAPARSGLTVVKACVEAGVPVLVHPPLLPGDEWAHLCDSGLVHCGVYPLFPPSNLARLRVIENGDLGSVTQVQVSGTPLYNAVALMRRFLGVGLENPTESAHRFKGLTLASLDFGDDRLGIFQVSGHTLGRGTPAQILIKTTEGEIHGDQVVHLHEGLITTTYLTRDPSSPESYVSTSLKTSHGSYSKILFGGQVLWTNPFPQMTWSEEDLGIAEYLCRLATHLRGEGPPPYSLIEGAHDARLIQSLTHSIRTADDPTDQETRH
jgi:hypothetical protein